MIRRLLGGIGGDPFPADEVTEEGSQRLQFDFPGDQLDIPSAAKVFEHIDGHVEEFGDALGIAERQQEIQLGPVRASPVVYAFEIIIWVAKKLSE